MSDDANLAHSPLGASGAERWMACPGSYALSRGHSDPESEHAALGTAAHTLGEFCLAQNVEPWTQQGKFIVGKKIVKSDPAGIEITKNMVDAVQTYVSWVRSTFPDRNQGNAWIERSFRCPTIHPLFYGTSDFIFFDEANRVVYVVDYKHGEGILVEVESNVQLMYYGCGVLEELQLWGKVDKIVLTVVQPRGFHSDGPVRQWSVSKNDLEDWLDGELVPAMNRAMVSRDTKSGEHCRFCPVRFHACPRLLADRKEFVAMAEKINKEGAAKLTPTELAAFLDMETVMKIAAKAAKTTAFERLNAGGSVPGYKLVPGKTNREWKEEAEKKLVAEYGDDAFTKPELKSPAEIDKLPKGKALTAQYAFKPPGALQVAPIDDNRPAVNRDMKSKFKPVNSKKEK